MEVEKKNNIIQLKKIKSKCPTCKKKSKNPFTPFCSKKCSDLDSLNLVKTATAFQFFLNMISTSVMIKLGKVFGNKMVDMQLSNNKLLERGIKMIMQELDVNYKIAKSLLEKYGSVRVAVRNYNE